MFWVYFGYWILAGSVIAVLNFYIEFIMEGEFELKLNEIPLILLIVVLWPIFTFLQIISAFEKFGNKPILKITRKEKK